MTHARARALAVIVDHHHRADAAALGAPSIFHGWPGLVWIERLIERHTGRRLPSLVESARRGRAAAVPPVPMPPALASTFLHGTRGRAWAERALAGQPPDDDRMPPATPLCFDTFANDGPVCLALDRDEGSAVRRAWSAFVAREHAALDQALAQGRAVPLGFAHGAAGLLFRALWLADTPGGVPEPVLRRGLDWLAAQRIDDGHSAWWPARVGEPVPRSWVASSLCNGSLGHAVVFLEAFARWQDERHLAIAHAALAGSADEAQLGLGLCCGHAGRAAVVSRFLRLGLVPRSREAIGTLERLIARIAQCAHLTGEAATFRPLSGLASCLPALHAEAPDAAVLDVFLPAPARSP